MVSVILKKILSSRPITFYGSIKEGTTLPWIFFFFFLKKKKKKKEILLIASCGEKSSHLDPC
jgi:hypothetical protein